jgi:hypothetical protein
VNCDFCVNELCIQGYVEHSADLMFAQEKHSGLLRKLWIDESLDLACAMWRRNEQWSTIVDERCSDASSIERSCTGVLEQQAPLIALSSVKVCDAFWIDAALNASPI